MQQRNSMDNFSKENYTQSDLDVLRKENEELKNKILELQITIEALKAKRNVEVHKPYEEGKVYSSHDKVPLWFKKGFQK